MDYFKRFLLWLVSGVGITCGAGLSFYAMDLAKSYWHVFGADQNALLASVHIVNVEPIKFTRYLTAAVTVKNDSSSHLGSVEVELALKRGDKTLFTCGKYSSSDAKPAATVRVQIECNEVEQDKVPADATYSASVLRVINPN